MSSSNTGYWDKWWNRRVTRRAVMGGGIGIAGLAIVGCGGDDSPATQAPTSTSTSGPSPTAPPLTSTATQIATSTGTPVPGGSIKIAGWTGGYVSWDPRFGDESDPTAYYTFTNDRLVTYRYGPQYGAVDFTPNPSLAESWEQIDDLTVSFKIREGVKWRNVDPVNGRALDAQDILYSYDQYRSPDSSFAASLAAISEMTAPDATTLVVKTAEPFAPLLSNLANPTFPVFAKEVVAKFGTLASIDTIIGTGAYFVESFQEGISVVFRKNPEYWRGASGITSEALPYLDSIEVALDPEWQTTIAQFRSGELAAPGSWFGFWGLEGQNNAGIESIRGDVPNMQEELHARPYMDRHIWMRTDVDPFTDERVRQAVSSAIDREVWYSDIYEGRSSYGREFAQSNPWFLPLDQLGDGAVFQQFNLQQAKQLLEAAGMADGFKTNLYTTSAVGPALQTESEFFAEQMRALNIEVEFNIAPDLTSWSTGAYTGNFDSGFGYGYGESFYDPDPFFDVFRKDHRRNRSHVDDPELNALIERQQKTIDPAERKAAIDDLQRHTATKLYYIVTVDPPQASAWQPWLKNWFMFDGADYGYTFIDCFRDESA